MAHGDGAEFILLISIVACALVVCIVPGDFMFCFGRRFDLTALEIVGLVFLCLGEAITVSMAVFTGFMIYPTGGRSEKLPRRREGVPNEVDGAHNKRIVIAWFNSWFGMWSRAA